MTLGQRRGRMEMLGDIMLLLREETPTTTVMYKANTSWKILNMSLSYLETIGLVSDVLKGQRKVWKLTEEGLRIAEKYQVLRDRMFLPGSLPLLASTS